jgi:hypothetical protein
MATSSWPLQWEQAPLATAPSKARRPFRKRMLCRSMKTCLPSGRRAHTPTASSRLCPAGKATLPPHGGGGRAHEGRKFKKPSEAVSFELFPAMLFQPNSIRREISANEDTCIWKYVRVNIQNTQLLRHWKEKYTVGIPREHGLKACLCQLVN